MPPLKGIDRGLTGEALKVLEESGHGRRIAVVDASYNIPRWAQVINYRGQTSAEALTGILALVPVDDGEVVDIMRPDPGSEKDESAYKATDGFDRVLDDWRTTDDVYFRYREDEMMGSDGGESDQPGFYSLANNEDEDTLFIRTPDVLPYACASFLVGHAQTAE